MMSLRSVLPTLSILLLTLLAVSWTGLRKTSVREQAEELAAAAHWAEDHGLDYVGESEDVEAVLQNIRTGIRDGDARYSGAFQKVAEMDALDIRAASRHFELVDGELIAEFDGRVEPPTNLKVYRR